MEYNELLNNMLKDCESLNESEYLFEMTKIISDKENNKTIWLENPSGYNNKYFKLYNSYDYRKATKVARISLLNPKYLFHKDSKDVWILNNKDKEYLINLLNKKTKSGYTIWEMLIIQYNDDNCNIDGEDIKYKYISSDEYNKQIDEYNKTEHSTGKALRLDYPMPDYMLLDN